MKTTFILMVCMAIPFCSAQTSKKALNEFTTKNKTNMKTKNQKLEGINFTAINTGNINELQEKIFLKDATKATATEISLTSLAPKTEIPFFHIHKKNEETYIILAGEGDFQVDDTSFPISSGSVIRVAPNGKRSMRNTSNEPMLYICIQAKEGSLEESVHEDGGIVSQEKKW